MTEKFNSALFMNDGILLLPNSSACLSVCNKSFVIAKEEAPEENKVFLMLDGAECACDRKNKGIKS